MINFPFKNNYIMFLLLILHDQYRIGEQVVRFLNIFCLFHFVRNVVIHSEGFHFITFFLIHNHFKVYLMCNYRYSCLH